MHENIKPAIVGDNQEVCCEARCPHHVGIYCDISEEVESNCLPWYQNEIERLKAAVYKAADWAVPTTGFPGRCPRKKEPERCVRYRFDNGSLTGTECTRCMRDWFVEKPKK